MRTTLFTFLVLLAFSACQPKPDQDAAEAEAEAGSSAEMEYLIVPGQRFGRIVADSSRIEQVLATYGADAKEDRIYLGEGVEELGVVLFGDDPKRRVEIYWDEELGDLPAFISVAGDENGDSPWHTDSGVKIGSTLAEVEAINGKPFMLYGFDWDYGGVVTNWNGGKLEGLNMDFRPTAEETPAEASGDQEIGSDSPAMREAKPVVSGLSIRFAPAKLD